MKEKFPLISMIISLITLVFAGMLFLKQIHIKHTAELSMATASLWMSEHHLHEVDEALEKKPADFKKAEKEAKELVDWLNHVPWPASALPKVKALAGGMNMLMKELKTDDVAESRSAYDDAVMKYHHLHHEVMELTGGHSHGDGHGGH